MPGPLARSAHITHSFNHSSPPRHQVGISAALPASLSSAGDGMETYPRHDSAAPSWSEGTGVSMYYLMTRAPVLMARHTGAGRRLSLVISSLLRNQLLGVLIEAMFYSWSHPRPPGPPSERLVIGAPSDPCHRGENGRLGGVDEHRLCV